MSDYNDERFFENLGDDILRKFYDEVERIAEKIGLILEREVQQVLMDKDKYATGDAYKSVAHDIEKRKDEILIKCFLGVKYAVYMHDGTRPHFPPIEPIAKWVKLKGIGQSYSIKSHKMVGNKFKTLSTMKWQQGLPLMERTESEYSSQVRSIAYAIARKIARKGTTGLKFFDIALKQATPMIENELKSLGNISVA